MAALAAPKLVLRSRAIRSLDWFDNLLRITFATLCLSGLLQHRCGNLVPIAAEYQLWGQKPDVVALLERGTGVIAALAGPKAGAINSGQFVALFRRAYICNRTFEWDASPCCNQRLPFRKEIWEPNSQL